MFKFWDEDGSGELNFAEFCCSLWNLLSIENLAAYAFILCDEDLSQKISVEEIQNLIEFMHKLPIKDSPYHKIFLKFKNEHLADVPQKTFCAWVDSNPGMCR
jgi:Ca2+-binding EF-hand superfamily protein